MIAYHTISSINRSIADWEYGRDYSYGPRKTIAERMIAVLQKSKSEMTDHFTKIHKKLDQWRAERISPQSQLHNESRSIPTFIKQTEMIETATITCASVSFGFVLIAWAAWFLYVRPRVIALSTILAINAIALTGALIFGSAALYLHMNYSDEVNKMNALKSNDFDTFVHRFVKKSSWFGRLFVPRETDLLDTKLSKIFWSYQRGLAEINVRRHAAVEQIFNPQW